MLQCSVCLILEENILLINEECVDLLKKFRESLSEIDWIVPFNLCNECNKKFLILHDFRELCLKSNLLQNKTIEPKSDAKDMIKEQEKETDKIFIETKDKAVSNSPNEESFEEILLKDDSNIVHKCKSCLRVYIHKNTLLKHEKICKEKKVPLELYDDQGLSKILKTKDYEHPDDLKTETTNFDDPPICDLCGTTFGNKYLLKRHVNYIHIKDKKYKCDICNRAFVAERYLDAHKKYHKGDRPYICTFCGKGFITKSDLYHHEKIHANQRSYRCEICPKAFNTYSNLHKHKICVHEEKSKWKHVCNICHKRFPIKVNLNNHLKIHTGEKNFSCHLCDKKCITNTALTKHIKTHSDSLTFGCDLCINVYKYRKSLNIHKAKTHNIGSDRFKNYFCEYCSKNFYNKNKLEKHIRSHTGDRPFGCPKCDKTFIDKSYVKQHLKSHSQNEVLDTKNKEIS